MPIFNYHGIKEAQVGSGRNYIGVGDFILKCQSAQEGVNHLNEVYFEAVFEVQQSTNQQQQSGAIVSYYQKLTGNANSLGNLKTFLGAIMNRNPMEISEEDVDYILSINQPLSNRYVQCRGRETIIGKNNPQNPAGKEWTVYDWIAAEQQPALETPAQQAAFSPPIPQQPTFTPQQQPIPQQQQQPTFTPQQQQQPTFTPPQQQQQQPAFTSPIPQQPTFTSPIPQQQQQQPQQLQTGIPPIGSQPQILTGWKPI
jgi:hypothetical protein